MAKSIDEELAEAEKFDSYAEEPVEDAAPTEQESASDEELAAENEPGDVESMESPEMALESSAEASVPEMNDASFQVAESPFPPGDPETSRSPDVTSPAAPGQDASPEVRDEPVTTPDFSDVQNQALEIVPPPDASGESVGDIGDIQSSKIESPEVDEPTAPSVSAEPLSAPPVIETTPNSEMVQEAPDQSAGFQGETIHPDVPEAVYQRQQDQMSDPAVNVDQTIFRQMQETQRQSEEFARNLAAELDPMWDKLRTDQEHTVRDYMQRQLWETTIIGRIK